MDHHRARLPGLLRRFLSSVLALLLVLVLAACGGSASGGTAGARVDPFTATDLRSGKAVTTTTFAGKPVLLAAWTSGCAGCDEELRELEALWKERGGSGLQVVAVNLDAAGAADRTLPDTIAAMGLTMPQWRDPDQRFPTHYAGLGLPMLVLLDRAGRVQRVWHRTLDVRSAEVQAALAEQLDG